MGSTAYLLQESELTGVPFFTRASKYVLWRGLVAAVALYPKYKHCEAVTHEELRFNSGGSHCVEGVTPVADTTKSTPCTHPLLSSTCNGHCCTSLQASGLDTYSPPGACQAAAAGWGAANTCRRTVL